MTINPANEGEDVNFSTVTADRQNIKRQHFTRADTNPHYPTQPTRSGPKSVQLHPDIENPVLTPSDVTEYSADLIADPFVVYDAGTYYCFVETRKDTQNAGDQDIAYATSDDGGNWTYQSIVIDESFNLSYPYVFKHDGEWYLVPSHSNGDLRIYRATSFPSSWTLDTTSADINPTNDPTPFYLPNYSGEPFDSSPLTWDGTWYLYNTETDLNLYYSDTFPSGSWTQHSASPIATSVTRDKPGGRPVITEDYIDVPFTDNTSDEKSSYKVRAYRVTDLSQSSYGESELGTSPIIGGTNERGDNWLGGGIHHIDMLPGDGTAPRIGVIDGLNTFTSEWSVAVVTDRSQPKGFVKAEKSSTQSLASANLTQVSWDFTDPDTENGMDLTNDQYTIPKTGYYDVSATIQLQAPSTTGFVAEGKIYNATTSSDLTPVRHQHVASTDPISIVIPKETYYLPKGTNLEVYAEQNSGNSQTIDSFTSHFEVQRAQL